MKKNKLLNLITIAKKDLIKWLYYAGVKTTVEFYQKADEIKNNSFHKYTDVVDHINYIKKLESLNV